MTYLCSDNKLNTPIKGFYVDNYEIKHSSRIIGAPIETGKKTFDNKVIDQIEIVVTGSVYLNGLDPNVDTNALDELIKLYQNVDWEFCSFLADDVGYRNLKVKEMPVKRSTDKYDVNVITVTLVQLMVNDGDSSANGQSVEYSSRSNIGYAAPIEGV